MMLRLEPERNRQSGVLASIADEVLV